MDGSRYMLASAGVVEAVISALKAIGVEILYVTELVKVPESLVTRLPAGSLHLAGDRVHLSPSMKAGEYIAKAKDLDALREGLAAAGIRSITEHHSADKITDLLITDDHSDGSDSTNDVDDTGTDGGGGDNTSWSDNDDDTGTDHTPA
ncbi:MAG: hypothetical protein WC553_00320 [Patescibacteria group bacterium]|jgi:hypothetical protein